MADKYSYAIEAKDRTKGAIRSATRGLNGLRDSVGRIDGAIAKLTGGLAILAGVGGIGALIASTNRSIVELDNLSKSLDVSAQSLLELQTVTRSAGIESDRLSDALRTLQERAFEASEGTGEGAEALERLNINARDFVNLSVDQQFEVVADAIAGTANASERTATAIQLLGDAGADLIPILLGGSEKLREQREEAGKNVSITDEQTEAVKELNRQFTVVSATIQNQLKQAFIDLAPEIELALGKITTYLDEKFQGDLERAKNKVVELKAEFASFNKVMITIGDTIITFVKEFFLMTGAFAVIKGVLTKQGAKTIGDFASGVDKAGKASAKTAEAVKKVGPSIGSLLKRLIPFRSQLGAIIGLLGKFGRFLGPAGIIVGGVYAFLQVSERLLKKRSQQQYFEELNGLLGENALLWSDVRKAMEVPEVPLEQRLAEATRLKEELTDRIQQLTTLRDNLSNPVRVDEESGLLVRDRLVDLTFEEQEAVRLVNEELRAQKALLADVQMLYVGYIRERAQANKEAREEEAKALEERRNRYNALLAEDEKLLGKLQETFNRTPLEIKVKPIVEDRIPEKRMATVEDDPLISRAMKLKERLDVVADDFGQGIANNLEEVMRNEEMSHKLKHVAENFGRWMGESLQSAAISFVARLTQELMAMFAKFIIIKGFATILNALVPGSGTVFESFVNGITGNSGGGGGGGSDAPKVAMMVAPNPTTNRDGGGGTVVMQSIVPPTQGDLRRAQRTLNESEISFKRFALA